MKVNFDSAAHGVKLCTVTTVCGRCGAAIASHR